MKRIPIIAATLCLLLLTAVGAGVLAALQGAATPLKDKVNDVNGPVVNPYLSSPLYALTHFDPSQSDSTPYGPPPGNFTVDLTRNRGYTKY